LGATVAACVNKSVAVDQTQDPAAGGAGADTQDPSEVGDDVLAVSGQITDFETSRPVAGALVTLEPGMGTITANAQGMYVFVAAQYDGLKPQQLYRISAVHDGYIGNFTQAFLQEGHYRTADIQIERAGAAYYLELDTTTLAFADDDLGSGSTASKDVRINLDTNSDDMASFSAEVDSASKAWLSVAPKTGMVGSSAVTIVITVDAAGLSGGRGDGTVTLAVPGDTKTLSVSFEHEAGGVGGAGQ
jgi:hypothetical protein